jgi:pantothenate kinase
VIWTLYSWSCQMSTFVSGRLPSQPALKRSVCYRSILTNLEIAVQCIVKRAAQHPRFVVGIAGPPGAGKSTLAHDLVQCFPSDTAKVVPMDGFHYDNAVLNELGLRARKGAPETFDYQGFQTILKRIRSRECEVAIPVFDRHADLARAGASIIHQAVKYVVVEGNYLLLDEPPWTGLAQCLDFTIFLDVPREELERRLLQRWLELGDSEEKARHWVAANDMPNVDRVLSRKRSPDLTLSR